MIDEDAGSRELTGWGRSVRRTVRVRRPDFDSGVSDVVLAERRVTVRGAGSSYGDAALPVDGVVLEMTARNKIASFDHRTGVVVLEGGALLRDVVQRTHPIGWSLPVIPGTEVITVGGAIAADVHGKNHPGAGSFGRHVLWMILLRADGTMVRLSPDRDAAEYWATIGGMGLTGVILYAAIQLARIETGWLIRNRVRTRSLEATIHALDALIERQASEPDHHVVAWLDVGSSQPVRGRGVVDEFYPAAPDDLPASVALFPDGSAMSTRATRSLPGPGVMSRTTIGTASAMRWRLSRSSNSALVPRRGALCFLDKIASWPAAFGRKGLVQYQFAVPRNRIDVVGEVLAFLAERRITPALATLKNFGEASSAPLSFPIPGWTLAVDIPARWLHCAESFGPVGAMVAEAGGRVYLAKDTVTDPRLITSMYPELEQWRRTRRGLDPEGRWTSALADRLGLVG